MAGELPQKIGKYQVTEVLGQGGMGIVYKGVDPAIGRSVAIKMMTGGFAENPDLLKRFQREAQSAGTLQHPNIVIIYELGTHENGNPYMAMEYIAGESLETMVQSRKRMSLVEKCGIMIQVLNGLQYAHSHGIVHRDIKPGNIMVLKDGSVKIVDFGIARISDNSMTKTGQIVGTINYMSPEQFNGHIVDGRSDIWSSAVMFYEFLTGALPFDGNETPTVILKILNDPPPPLKEHLQNCPAELEEIVNKSLAKDREERYATAEDFAFDLARVQEQLKQGMVVEYVDLAKAALAKKELTKAKELLQQVLKVDTKHESAKELMKQVQAQLATQQRGEQIRQLRSSAEEALSNKMLDDAVSFCDQALKLDKDNPELLQLHKMVQQAKARKDQIEKSIRKAEGLREDGDLVAALHIAEEALAIDPKDSNAKSVRDVIAAEIKKLQSQKELMALLDEARKEVSARHFTAAMVLIRRSEDVAPGATQAGSLRNVVNTAREQEARRIAVDQAATEAELALYSGTMESAQQKVESAIRRFPGDDRLTDLQQNARRLREAAGLGEPERVEQRSNVLLQEMNYEPAIALLEHAIKAAPDEKLKLLLGQAQLGKEELSKKAATSIAEAQRLFNSGKVDDAAQLLESQPPGLLRVPAFLKQLEECRGEQDRLGGIEVGVIEARKTMEKGDVNGAWTKASALLKTNPTSAPVQVLVKEIESRRASMAKEAVEKAMKEARSLLLARQGTAANRTMMNVASLLGNVPPETKRAYDALQREISATGMHQLDADKNATIVAGSAGRSSGVGTMEAPPASRTMAEQAVRAPAPPPPKPFPTGAVVGVVLVAVLAVGGWFGYQQFFAPKPEDSYVEINATPWATVTSIVSENGKYKKDVNEATPVRVKLPTGNFVVSMTGPDGKTQTEKITVSPAQFGSISESFEAVTPDEIVKTSK